VPSRCRRFLPPANDENSVYVRQAFQPDIDRSVVRLESLTYELTR
jgi:hypothetical protein